MKNKVVAMILTASLAFAVAACSSTDSSSDSSAEASTEASAGSTEVAAEEDWRDDPQAYLKGITASDYVDLPDNYSYLTVEAEPVVEVLDENVEDYINSQLDASKTLEEVEDRDTVQEGDIVNIDYVGTLDGEEFDGGSAEGYDLEIGSGSFIDGFEDGLIGVTVGETVSLDLTFPEEYGDSTLAGQDVVFEVTVNKIQEYVTPELTNEYVESIGLTDDFGNVVSTVDEFRTYIRNYLTEENEYTYTSNVQSAILTELENGSTFKQDPPEAMIERYVESINETIAYQAAQYGIDQETLMSLYGLDESSLREEAVYEAKQSIILQAIADAEGLNMEEADFTASLEEAVASSSYYESVDEVSEEEVENYREYLTRNDVLNYLMEKATVVAPTYDDATTGETAAEIAAE